MNWIRWHDALARELSPEISSYVLKVLGRLEQENVFDAPGVISGVLRQMRIADSDVIRAAVSRTESVLKATLPMGRFQRLGA